MRTPFVRIFLGSFEKRDITSLIERFRFKDAMKEDSGVEFDVYSDQSLTLLEDPLLVTGASLTFFFGFTGEIQSQTHTARITDVEVTYADRITLTVKAKDAGSRMKRSPGGSSWTNKTSSEIAEEIAQKNNLASVVDTTSAKLTITQGTRNDWDFLRYLASIEKDGNYTFFIRAKTLYFVRVGYNKESLRTYTRGESLNFIRFSPKWKESTTDASAGSTELNSIDLKSKNDIAAKADGNTQKNAVSLGENMFAFSKDGLLEGIVKTTDGTLNSVSAPPETFISSDLPGNIAININSGNNPFTDINQVNPATLKKKIVHPVSNTQDASNKVNAEHKNAVAKLMAGTLELLGDPTLLPNEVITIQGVARRHAGNWLIESVEHTIQPGSAYTTTVELHKNGTQAPTGVRAESANLTKGKEETTGPKKNIFTFSDTGKFKKLISEDLYYAPATKNKTND